MIFGDLTHFYFYHIIPKGSILKPGILSPMYKYKHGDKISADIDLSKYRDRLVGGWNIYPGRDPDSLTTEEVINGIEKFRGKGGVSRIYMFKYPPYHKLGKQMSNILKYKDAYRIDLNNPELKKLLIDIDYGHHLSYSGNAKLTRKYYETITPEEYFANYNENDGMLLFAHLNHISVWPKEDYIPAEFCDKIKVPETLKDVYAVS